MNWIKLFCQGQFMALFNQESTDMAICCGACVVQVWDMAYAYNTAACVSFPFFLIVGHS